MKIVLFLAFILSGLFSQSVLVAKKNISFREILTNEHFDIKIVNSNDISRTCEVLDINFLETNNRYIATKYIRLGSVMCQKDVQILKTNEVLFNFGSLEIKTDGEIINETDEYITIKKPDGSVNKIYKDGRER